MARILIVDDSRVIREKLKILILQSGNEVVAEANDGSQAIMLYKLLKPDVVTVDMNMGQMGGIETIQNLLSIDADARVIVISSVDEKETVEEALNCGAKSYVLKPFEKEQVFKAIHEVTR